MKAASVGLCVLSLALAGCPGRQLAPTPDAGSPCPANSEPSEEPNVCTCIPGYMPNPAGTACVINPGDGGPNPPVDAGPDDAGPDDAGPDCTPLPYPEEDSRAYFDANLLQPTLDCASCHVQQGQTPTFDETDAYDVMVALIEPGATSPEDTAAGKIYRVNGASKAGHAFPFSASAAAATWIEHHLDGVPPPGCE